MRWLLDTNVLIDAFAGESTALAALQKARSDSAEWIGFSSMTCLEIFGYSGLNKEDEEGLRNLIAGFAEVAISAEVIEQAIHIRRATKIEVADAIIAATAIVKGAEVITRNVDDFKRVPSLVVRDTAGV